MDEMRRKKKNDNGYQQVLIGRRAEAVEEGSHSRRKIAAQKYESKRGGQQQAFNIIFS